MKIEKISNRQMKFVFLTDDLRERDIKISELSYGSDKTQQLFKEIMTLVQDEGEFIAENTPLMFEAMRVGVDSLVVMVTKINQAPETDSYDKFSLIPSARKDLRYKKGEFINPPEAVDEDEASYIVFSFAGLDIMAAGASRLPSHFSGDSQVHKIDGKYFLVIKNETEDNQTTGELESVLFEYGEKHVSNVLSRQYLIERGEAVIAEGAVEKLRLYHLA